jgi:hypothetical protein
LPLNHRKAPEANAFRSFDETLPRAANTHSGQDIVERDSRGD